MKRVSVIGHYGCGCEYLDGQTIKTKIITSELCKECGEEEVLQFDTHGGAKTFFKAPLYVLKAMRNSNNIIILPAHNGICIFGRLLPFFKYFFKNRKIHYVVIGGWLPEFLKSKKRLAKHLKHFDCIYVETNTMRKALMEQGFHNVTVMPNCKNLHILDKAEIVFQTAEPYKLCTFSRVMKEKGIEDAVNAVKAVNKQFGRTVYTLDIYGQVNDTQSEWFRELKKSFPSYVKYRGIVPFDKSVEVLKNYFALLFPTYYDGEGFAGTLIDALAAGVPVIASDWRYNTEIVREGKTGCIYPSQNTKALENKLVFMYNHKVQWNGMKIMCINMAHNYLPEVVITELVARM